MMGYEPGDQVRVVFPLGVFKSKQLVREGVIVARLGNGYFRIVFKPPRHVDDWEIEQALVNEKHFA